MVQAEIVTLLRRQNVPDGGIAIMCLAAEVASDVTVPLVGVVNGSTLHVVNAAAGFAVHYNGHWYNLASGAVVK